MKTGKTNFIKLLICCLSLLGIVVWSAPAIAQSALTGIIITGIDASQFPQIDATFTVETLDRQGTSGLTEADFTLLEDGQPVQFQLEPQLVGAQVVFIIDASSNINQTGGTGQKRIDECKAAIARFVGVENGEFITSWVEDGVDWVSVLATQEEGVFTVTDPLSSRTELYNTLYQSEIPTGSRNTSLFDSLFEALRVLEQPISSTEMQKAIIVFSDGIDTTSDINFDNIISQANARKIPIYTVLLGRNEPRDKNSLRALATLTQGHYVHLQSLEAMDEIFERISEQRYGYAISYQSQVNQSGKHSLVIKASGDNLGRVSGQGDFEVTVYAPEVQITLPEPGVVITRSATVWTKDLQTIPPVSMTVQAQITWPQGEQREIEKVEFLMNGNVVTSLTQPGQDLTFEVDLTPFETAGKHTLSFTVKVYDQLGVVTQSPPTAVDLIVNIPRIPWERIGTIAALAMSFVLLVIVIRNRSAISRGIVIGAEKLSATMQFGKKQAKAYLVVLEGEDDRRPIPITGSLNKIGRSRQDAKILFHTNIPESPVGRLHCTLSETDGRFSLRDESSTNGTYLNGTEIPEMEWVSIQDRDEIELAHVNLGGIKLQFIVAAADGSFPADVNTTQSYHRS